MEGWKQSIHRWRKGQEDWQTNTHTYIRKIASRGKEKEWKDVENERTRSGEGKKQNRLKKKKEEEEEEEEEERDGIKKGMRGQVSW